MINIKKNFKNLFIVLLVFEFIMLVVITIMYYFKSENIAENISYQKKIMNIMIRDSFIEYLKKKFRLIIEDELLIVKGYNQLIKWYPGPISSSLYNIINSTNIKTSYNAWYKQNQKLSNESAYYGIDNACSNETLFYFQEITTMIYDIFNKFLEWNSRRYIDIEYFNLILDKNPSSCLLTFPKRNIIDFNESFENEGCLSSTPYNPKCRKSFTETIFNKIIFSKPSMLKRGTVINEICVKSEESSQRLVACFAINYYDLDAFKNLENNLDKNKEIMLVYYTPIDGDEISVLYDSKYFTSELECNVKLKSCNPINFFDVYFKQELKELYNNLTDINKEEKYLDEYRRLKQNNNLINEIINIIEKTPSEFLSITVDNANNLYFYNQNKKVVVKNNTFVIQESDDEEIIYVMPLISKMEYNQTSYKIEDLPTEKSEYYLIIREIGPSKKDRRIKFFLAILIEIGIFLFYVLVFNILVYFLFKLIYIYLIKGFTYPLKQTKKIYFELLNKSITNKNFVNYNDLSNDKIDLNKILNQLNLNKKDEKNSCVVEFYDNFWENSVLKKISEFFVMEHHQEVLDSLKALKAIKIILNYKNIYSDENLFQNKNNDINSNLNIINSNFKEALKFFSECFFNKYNDKEKIDYGLMKLIIENIFLSLINKHNQIKEKLINNSRDKEIFNTCVSIMNEIDNFYNLCKKHITWTKGELCNILKNSRDSWKTEDIQKDLLILSLLEENMEYYYSSYLCLLFNEILHKKIDEKVNIADNMDEDEKALLIKLQKKEKMNNYKILKSKQKEDIIDYKTNKLIYNFSEMTFGDYLYIDDNTKKYLYTIIQHCEKYLLMNQLNQSELKKIENLYEEEQNEKNSSYLDKEALIYIKDIYEEERSTEILTKLKNLCILLYISKFYILCDNEQKGINFYEIALNEIRDLNINIEKIKSKSLNKNKWISTDFAMLFINTIIYERILVIFSMLCNKYAQEKTELFVNLNILDFSPIYSKSIRLLTITKIISYIDTLRNYLVSKSNYSMINYNKLVIHPEFIDIQRSIYKMICLRNVLVENVTKKVLFLFDLGNNFIKDNSFKELLFKYFEEHIKENTKNNFEYYFAGFDSKLHFQFEPNYEDEEITLGKKFNKKYIEIIQNFEEIEIINEDNLKNLPNKKHKSQNNKDNIEPNFQRMKFFFNFIKKYNGDIHKPKLDQEGLQHRADKALYHGALFGFNDGNYDNLKYMNNKTKKIIKKEIGYLILITNLDATFTGNKYNWKEMTELIYDKKLTVIILISYDPSLEIDRKLQEKVSYFKNFLKAGMIDGHIFIMRSFSIFKFILNSIFPIKVSKYNIEIFKHSLCSIENINHARPNELIQVNQQEKDKDKEEDISMTITNKNVDKNIKAKK